MRADGAKTINSMVKVLRPKQWIKNLLIFATPFLAEQLGSYVFKLSVGFIAYCSISSIGYIINDWLDKELDGHHPLKKTRPFSSGELKFKHLLILLISCMSVLIISIYFLNFKFLISVIIYLGITIFYSFGIKVIPVLEIIWLSLGFLIRCISGSIIINEPPSGWFLVTVGFGSLFIVSAKRMSEFKSSYGLITRKVISKYTEQFLVMVLTTSSTISLITYSLWVFEVHPDSIFAQFSILPFTLCIFLYSWISNINNAEIPENLFFSNILFQLCGASCLVLLIISIYL